MFYLLFINEGPVTSRAKNDLKETTQTVRTSPDTKLF